MQACQAGMSQQARTAGIQQQEELEMHVLLYMHYDSLYTLFIQVWTAHTASCWVQQTTTA